MSTATVRLLPLSGLIALITLATLGLGTLPAAYAAEPDDRPLAETSEEGEREETPQILEDYSILGSAQQREAFPGSAERLGPVDLERFEYGDMLRVLRQVPGVYVQEEDGYGLRPNIGIRGSGLDRSGRITLMEDNVLIAPAPYAASSAYYFPSTRRMESVEVVKGAASVMVGPRTTGGALNMISTPIPDQREGRVRIAGGQDASLESHITYGGTEGRFGWLLETVQDSTDGFKHLPDGSETGYHISDYVAKARYASPSTAAVQHSLQVKIGSWDHVSDETYLGLTQADFDADPYRRYAGSQLDRMDAEHQQFQVDYRLQPAADWDLSVTAYRNDFKRDWFKLGSVDGTGISSILDDPANFTDEMSWIRGADSPADAFNLRHNNREYYAQGVQGSLGWSIANDGVVHDLRVGLRYHEDEEDRLQDEDLFQMQGGRLILTTDGPIGSQANRLSQAEALAFFAQDTITAGRWQVTPGLRIEDIDLTRLDFDTSDPSRSLGPTRVRRNSVTAVIPGVGVSYELDQSWRLFGSVHRGFNPPSPGSASDEEESLNLEFGARYRVGAMQAEATLFRVAYENLVGTCTASSGGGCVIGDQFDAGEARVQGLELSADGRIVSGDTVFPLGVSWTWTDTRFENSFSSSFDPWGDVIAGDEFPYVPDHQVQLRGGLVRGPLEIALAGTWVDAARTVAGQGPIPAGEGTDSAFILDASAHYGLSRDLDLFLRVDNLLDDDYVAARRPAGARPGKPRTLLVGFDWRF